MAKLLEKYGKVVLPKRGEQIEGKVVQILKDKILVDFGGKSDGEITARDFAELKKSGTTPQIGEKISALVLEPENEAGTTVLSLRTTTADAIWKKLEGLLEEGVEIEAKVGDLAKSGILVDVLGVRGFVPATVADLTLLKNFDKLKGRPIKVKILEVNRDSNRLICATASPHPKVELDNLEKEFTKGEKYSGKVIATLPFGIVVRCNNLSAFVPSSELAWEKVDDVASVFKVGAKLDFIFQDVDFETGKVKVSPKLAKPNPIVEFAKKYPQDAEISGKVLRISEFGVFVSLAEGVEGLIHISKIPPDLKFEVGQPVNCTIDSVDIDSRRVSLSPVLTVKPVGYR